MPWVLEIHHKFPSGDEFCGNFPYNNGESRASGLIIEVLTKKGE
jgi:hypothetical protein